MTETLMLMPTACPSRMHWDIRSILVPLHMLSLTRWLPVSRPKVMRVRPTVLSILDYSKGFGHTDLVSIEAGDIAETLDSMRHHWLIPLGEAA